jgi:aryl-alcohol dehydrogenase-like predicted oxidoreductase
MERTTLGRTGLEVSVAGLGCGGHSRLDQNVHSITAGPRPEVDIDRLRAMFGAVDSVSGNSLSAC